jgi:hypothetical protein
VYKPLPPGIYPIAVGKYININKTHVRPVLAIHNASETIAWNADIIENNERNV